ncbi:hypothetical protein L596_008549 [Steinernema carpocapsae]|uniref:Uncharacterized protein n=1 Tax=Steinernema carpocapsae TaxID=34508 RepID=A0A4U5PCU4_STECR|nr:hypothetical protein L596_008549 [Steinernema carpocapsae]
MINHGNPTEDKEKRTPVIIKYNRGRKLGHKSGWVFEFSSSETEEVWVLEVMDRTKATLSQINCDNRAQGSIITYIPSTLVTNKFIPPTLQTFRPPIDNRVEPSV